MANQSKDRFFALDLRFDWHYPSQMQYRFSERCGGPQQLAAWEPIQTSGPKKNKLGTKGDSSYLVIAVWGIHVDPSTDQVRRLCLDFNKVGKPAGSPFSDNVTSRLSQGVQLGPGDMFKHEGSTTIWVLDPTKQDPELPTAGFKDRFGSALWFHYLPKMIPGNYEFHVKLNVSRSPADKAFHLDPEMEVGDNDGGDDSDTY